jgi:hypothetical protein
MENFLQTRVLTKVEWQLVALYLACDCLRRVYEGSKEPAHVRRKRKLFALSNLIAKQIPPQLPAIKQRDVFVVTMRAANELIDELLALSTMQAQFLLNLALYCLSRLPVNYKIYEELDELFIMWGVHHSSSTVRDGQKLFETVEEQAALAMIRRKGVML